MISTPSSDDLADVLERAGRLAPDLREVAHRRDVREQQLREAAALARELAALADTLIADITDPTRLDRFPIEGRAL